ncbi:SdpI family protein [Gordonia shandongensis]|uniref:SdpI family protein n=1 Tax=Gordonia shandongensis TaxID=376351 RepID=UPI0004002A24|nr:SdpI family protein [Gordonia shandongensis]
MAIASIVVSVVALVLAAVWLGVGVAGLTGTLRRNRWVGVRSVETMRSEEAFALAGRVAGPGFVGASVILAVAGALGVAFDRWGFLFALFGIVVALLVISAIGTMAIAAARTVPPTDEGGCGCCSGGAETASTCGSSADADQAAADCGESSCGSCALSGMCLAEDNPHNRV